MIFSWLALVGFLALLLQLWNSTFVREYRKCLRLTSHLAGWKTLPIIGNAHQILGDTKYIYKVLVCITEGCEQNGGLFKLWLGPKVAIFVTRPDYIKAITNTYLEKSYIYRFSKPWLGNGLLTAPADQWKKNIKKLGNTFSINIVEGFQDVFNNQAEKLVNGLKSEAGKPPFDVMHKYINQVTLESVCQTSLGAPDISENMVTKEYFDAFMNVSQSLMYRGLRFYLHPDSTYRLTASYKSFMKSVQVLRDLNETVMAKRKKVYQEKGSEDNNNSRFKPFLDILLEASRVDPSITDEQIGDEISTIIFGGQETSAVTLQYLFLTLGYRKDIQDKLYKEMKDLFGNEKRPVTKEDLAQMPYCEAVINETLRLYPPAPAFIRLADSDLELETVTIPSGAICILNAWGVARSTKVWGEDAAEFNPDRWLNGPAVPPPGSFLPFSYGRRSCIGKKYAMLFMKTVVSHCIRDLAFDSEAYKMTFKIDIIMHPVSGHLLQVRLRDNKKSVFNN